MKDWSIDEAMAAQSAYEASGGDSADHDSPLAQWAALQTIEELRRKYEGGDPFAVLEAVFECGLRQLVMPDWVALGFIERMRLIKHYKARSLDEAFGTYLPKGAKLTAYRQSREKSLLAYREVRRRHNAGESVGEGLFELVGKDLAIGGSKVRDYYYEWDRRLNYKKHPK